MKIRIQNDGKPSYATEITDVETGKRLDHITRVDLTIDVKDQTPRALLTAILPVTDVIADADIQHVCPVCGRHQGENSQETPVDDVDTWKTRIEQERRVAARDYELSRLVFTALGEASMCWSETPKGTFDSVKAKQIGDELLEALKNLV